MALPTSTNKSPIVQIVVWFAFIVIILSFLSRTLIKLAKARWSFQSLYLEDYLLTAAVLLSLAQSLAVNFQAVNGFGQPPESLSQQLLSRAEKAGYAADLLYVLGLCVAKMATLAFIETVSPADSHRRVGKLLALLVLLWAICAEVVLLFKCKLPTPWASFHGNCLQFRSWWYYFEISNAAIELVLIVFPLIIVRGLQASLKRRAAMGLPFVYRTLVIPACIIKLALLGAVDGDPNTTFAGWKISITTQVIQCLAVTAACALYMNTILETLHSGFLDGADLQRQGRIHQYTNAASQPYHVGSGSGSMRPDISSNKKSFDKKSFDRLDPVPLQDFTTSATARSFPPRHKHSSSTQHLRHDFGTGPDV